MTAAAGTTHHVWIVGRSGLLGSALGREYARRTGEHVEEFAGPRVPWADPAQATEVLVAGLDDFFARVAADDTWSLLWAAGAGVIGSSAETFQQENVVVAGFFAALASRAPADRGGVFLASSASVYAGADAAPYDELSEPVPTSDYPRAKLENERVVAEALDGRVPHVVGRITTLFGPGQNLTKSQGLVARLCLQAALRRPVVVYVPLDTLRDYISADDAAATIRRNLTVAVAAGDRRTRIRNVAHGEALSIGALSSLVRAVSHRRAGEMHVPGRGSGSHVRDLRVHTAYPDEIRDLPRTPLAVGIREVYEDVLARYLQGALTG